MPTSLSKWWGSFREMTIPKRQSRRQLICDAGITPGILAVAAAVCTLLTHMGDSDSAVPMVFMLAVLLGGAGYAMYAMTGDDKLPTQHPTLGDTELEPIGYDWSVPVLGNVLNRTFEQPSTLTVQKLGEMTEAAPELVLPDWAQRTTLTLKDSAGSVVVQGDAAAFAMYAYPKNGS